MKKIRKILFGALLLTFMCITAYAASTESYSWYFKPKSDGMQPELIPEAASFVEKYPVIALGDSEEKTVYLTFDAGYENGNVEKILDVLREKNVPGAFFILPQIMRENADLVHRMKDEGHLICNHTRHHKNMSKITDFDTFSYELTESEKLLRELCGIEMDKFYRPPEGRFSEQNLEYAEKLGYTTVFWSLAYADWDNANQLSPDRALELVLSRTHNGCVALFHPTSSTNAAILGDYIDTLRADGYTFKSLADFKPVLPSDSPTAPDDPCMSDHTIYAANRDAGKYVALTFDDGPHPVYTEQILDILAKNNARATFFVIGENAERYPELVRKEFDAGHEIGNHTYSHPDMRTVSVDKALEEIGKAEDVITNITGVRPTLFRSPGGVFPDELVIAVENIDCKPVLWSWRQDTKDWSMPSAEHIVKNVLANLKDGDIILFHDFNLKGSPTPHALEMLLPALAEKGYTCVTVSELIERGEAPLQLSRAVLAKNTSVM